jgi:hypothetical protein
MSFSSSAGNSISFRPATLHINWDGVSDAKVAVALDCYDSAASYSVTAYPVHESSGSATYESPLQPEDVDYWEPVVQRWQKGDRLVSFTFDGVQPPEYYIHPDISLPSTVASGTATIQFSSITAVYFTHAWRLTGTKGTVTRVILAGGVFVDMPGPFSPGSVVGGTTASGCF